MRKSHDHLAYQRWIKHLEERRLLRTINVTRCIHSPLKSARQHACVHPIEARKEDRPPSERIARNEITSNKEVMTTRKREGVEAKRRRGTAKKVRRERSKRDRPRERERGFQNERSIQREYRVTRERKRNIAKERIDGWGRTKRKMTKREGRGGRRNARS